MADSLDTAILQALIDNGSLTLEKGTEIQQQEMQGKDLFTLLVKSELVKEEVFTRAKAAVLQMPYVNLAEKVIPKEVLTIIPESTARSHMIVAYEQTEAVLRVAMADPNDAQIVEFIHKKVGKPVEVAVASVDNLRLAFDKYQQTLETEFQNLLDDVKGVAAVADGDANKAAEELPIIKITDAILKHAVTQDASDIHIEPTETSVIIRYRIDGMLHDVLTLPKAAMTGIVARIKILSNLKIDEHRLPQDGRFKLQSTEYNVAYRVSTLPVFDGEKIVMRLLDESGNTLRLDDIGMSKRGVELFRNNINKPHGMILVTGPTGSGKTTTLYAAMTELNQPDVNISTIEDPIEYRMERINQTQVQPKIGLTFSNGLRALVRQDPDIIMVGEIRDEETASLAVNASLTGHLVLSTLHTNSAAGAVPRLLDMKVEPFLIASTTNLMMAQRLVRKLCQDCHRKEPVNQTILDSLSAAMDLERLTSVLKREGVLADGVDLNSSSIYVPVGCPKCHEGYKGRIGIYEFLEVTPVIQKMITGRTTAQELEENGRKEQNMVTMVEDGVIKALNGVTSLEEVLRVAKE